MYDRSFFRSRLGRAALVSIAAMVTFVAVSSQVAFITPAPAIALGQQVGIA